METQSFCSVPYSMEELVAEMGACYLKSHAGIATVTENNAAYIHEWLKKLKSDKKFIVQASAHAQKAADFILGIRYQKENGAVEEIGIQNDEPVF